MADSSKLVESLYAVSQRHPKLIKSSVYSAPADKTIEVTSWKMNEFKYYTIPSPFPTLARGLFTTTNGDETEGSDVKYRIIIRGYDKFFNIGEVPWTNWFAIERHTVPPYTLTLKSNGCIIFMAALSPDKLLITSKHSLGPVAGADESHAQVGERWLMKHLEDAGKTPEQLAAYLWEKQWTAVAELCDDSFEEHVLPISRDMTGLHLHGLNANSGDFNTQAQPVVDAFAEEWGFIKTASIVLNTEREVREFTEEVGKTGKWNGEAVEGFVVRTTIGPRPTDVQKDTPPYAPGTSFFFKVKFDEPYMMYRDWRELTKALLSAKQRGNISNAKISKAKLRRRETIIYKHWVEKEIMQNPKAFESYTHNRGIIAVRDRFFEWLESPEGGRARETIKAPEIITRSDDDEKVVLIPIAIPGCGKTTVAVALAHLFGFGHTQSDNIKAKKAAPVFQQNIVDLLKTHDVVIADRNNHLTQHRDGIRQAVSTFNPKPRLIALNWSVTTAAPATVHRIVTDRILLRGDNHQTLTPTHVAEYEEVVWRFLKDSEELAEAEVDDVIEMEIEESVEDALTRAVNGVVELLGVEKPSDEKMGEALRIAVEYRAQGRAVAKKKEAKQSAKKEKAAPRYYGLLPEIDLSGIVEGVMHSNVEVPDSGRAFWEHLKSKNRVAGRPHVTIVHTSEREKMEKIWDACERLTQESPPLFEIKLGSLVWNDRVMALAVEGLSLVAESGGEAAAEKFLNVLGQEIRGRFHITVGTMEPSIPPVEAKDLVQSWRAGGNANAVPLENVTARGRVKGLMS